MSLDAIKQAPKADLLDRDWLEVAIATCGLGHRPTEFPASMHHYFGGLGVWQYPCQLAPYLIALAGEGVRSYAEVGLAAGGTFIVTCEYLRRFNDLEEAVGVDIQPAAPHLHAFAAEHPEVELVHGTSDALGGRNIDLVFIDADHSEEACQRDLDNVASCGRLTAFHDIVESTCPGVARVWSLVEGRKQEFIEQYENAASSYGIGLVNRAG